VRSEELLNGKRPSWEADIFVEEVIATRKINGYCTQFVRAALGG